MSIRTLSGLVFDINPKSGGCWLTIDTRILYVYCFFAFQGMYTGIVYNFDPFYCTLSFLLV